MKKMIIVTIIMAVIFLASCGEDNTPVALDNETTRVKNELAFLKANTNDNPLWESTDIVQDLIESTVEDNIDIEVQFRLKSSGGYTFETEVYPLKLSHINDSWRELCSNRLVYNLANSVEITNAHANNETTEVIGMIMSWKQRNLLGDLETFSICDIDFDGNWDFVSKSVACFSGDSIIFYTDDGMVHIKDPSDRHSGVVPLGGNMKLSGFRDLILAEEQ